MKTATISVAVCSVAVCFFVTSGLQVQAEEASSAASFNLLPGEGERAIGAGYFDLSASDDGGDLSFGYFAPVSQSPTGLLMLDLGAEAAFSQDFGVDGYSLLAGLFYRYRTSSESALGFNVYVEGGRRTAEEFFMGLASLGIEYEFRPLEQDWFFQGGGNYYIAFDDYTDVSEYGYLGAAPRDGMDAFLSLGYDFEGFSLRGSVIGFDYFETSTARPLTGYGFDVEIETSRGLPEGMTLGASLALRDDSRLNSDLSAQLGLSLEYVFGRNAASGRIPERDCALVRVGDELPRVDCSQAVVVADMTDAEDKEGEPIGDMRPAPRGVIVDRPRRHLGFGSMFTPIEYNEASITLVKLTDGDDDSFTFQSDILELNATVSTSGGRGQIGPVPLEAGQYEISEIVDEDWTLESASCIGVESQSSTGNGVQISVTPGARVVCTFLNAAVEPPEPEQCEIQITNDSALSVTLLVQVTGGNSGLAGSFTPTIGPGDTFRQDCLPTWNFDENDYELQFRVLTPDTSVGAVTTCNNPGGSVVSGRFVDGPINENSGISCSATFIIISASD